MARKDYPFNRRDEKKMNKLFSGFITGIILAPITLLNSINTLLYILFLYILRIYERK